MKNSIIFLFLTIIFFSCNTFQRKEKTEKTLNFSKIETSNIQSVFDFTNSKLIQLETDSNLRLSDELKTKISDDNIFIFDYGHNKLFRFSKEGQFINKIGQRGRGPEEYLAPGDFIIDKSKQMVEILGEPHTTVTRYTYDGQFVNKMQFKFPSQSFMKGDNETYYFYRGVNSASEPYRLTVTDTTKILSNHLKDKGNPGIGHILEKDAFSSNSNSIFLMESLLPTIYDVSASEPRKRLTLDYGSKTIDEDATSEYSSVMEFFQKITSNGFYSIKDIASSDKKLILKIIYQEKNNPLIFNYLFYSLDQNSSPHKIQCNEDKNNFLAYTNMHECFNNYILLTINPFDILNSDISDSFPLHFFNYKELDESDNPIILLMKLKH